MPASASDEICPRCVMPANAPGFEFVGSSGCSFCSEFSARLSESQPVAGAKNAQLLDDLVEKIKADGAGKPFDCIVGVSGGVDSSWVLVNAVRLGLRPLAVHMDNGWNSELAQNNISNLINSLNVDLYTYVIEWDEYRKLMQAFFDADVLDVELLYDNAMLAVNYRQAKKYRVKYILSGDNIATEGMRMPPGWNWLKYDKKNIADIGHRGGVSLNSFPAVGTFDLFFNQILRGIKWVHFLDFFEFNKFDAIEELKSSYGYKPYPYKHYESIFTRFYQGYLLPRKFGVDKRALHLSTLIVSGQLSREDALGQLEGIPYPSEESLQEDIHYFLKKMEWQIEELEKYLQREPVHHSRYRSEKRLWDAAKVIYGWLYRGKV